MKMALDRSIPRDAKGAATAKRLLSIANLTSIVGNPDDPFWYLGGRMSNMPKFNFPEFERVARNLRNAGYNIVSPAELEDPEITSAALGTGDAADHAEVFGAGAYESFLSRDMVIISLPTCVGGIFMEGWHLSKGACLETYVLDRLGKQVYEHADGDDGVKLTLIDRDARLAELRAIDATPEHASEVLP